MFYILHKKKYIAKNKMKNVNGEFMIAITIKIRFSWSYRCWATAENPHILFWYKSLPCNEYHIKVAGNLKVVDILNCVKL